MQLRTKLCKKHSVSPNSADLKDYPTSERQTTSSACSDAPICAADWGNNEEIYFVCNNNGIWKFNTASNEMAPVATLPDNFKTTDLHWLVYERSSTAGEALLLCSQDGRFLILNSSGRAERNIAAHTGPINSGRWSTDGAGLLTAGEDGVIKIWSRFGMLRSTVLQSEQPVRCARWSPNSSSIVYCQEEHISVKPLAANSKAIKWRAHNGLVLSLCWSRQSNTIVSGGEDCRFKIWDTQGSNLFTSSREEHPITSVAFNPEKELLLVGSFNLLKLCSHTGWCYTSKYLSKPAVGSFHVLNWSPNGTQIACGSAAGHLIAAYPINEEFTSRTLKATIKGKCAISFQDSRTGNSEMLDLPQPIIRVCMGYGHLVVATTSQLHIYSEQNLNTPIIIEGRIDVRIIQMGKRFFLAMDMSSIWIYTYTGRLHLNPRYTQAQIPFCTQYTVSLGLETFAIRDNTDQTGKSFRVSADLYLTLL